MLSKVINGREGSRAQPAVFASVILRTASRTPMRPDADDDGAGEQPHQLLERIQRLEKEVVAARSEGFESGRRQGEQQARSDLAPVLERMNSSVAELIGLRQEIRRRAEKDVVQLSLLIAKRILHRELSIDLNALTALARVVFERLTRAESYRVTIHPQFLEAIRSALPGNQISRVQIEPDPSADPGTFVIRSEEGLIDASVDAQLEEISRGLTDRLSKS